MSSAALTYAHTGTPSLQVSDARGLPVRAVQLYRREGQDPIETRVTEQRMDAAARLLASRDAYLFELARTDELTPFNLTQVTSLSGMSLLTESVDAGWRVLLAGDAGQAVERWDGRGSHSLTEYDDLLRPVAVRESGLDVVAHTLERFTWAGIETDAITHNVCGQLVRHDDPAGTVQVNDLNMAGEVLSHTRRFLLRMDPPDWPVLAADRDALLETADGATTSCQFSCAGELLMQTDALHNRQAFAYSLAGQLKDTRLTLAGEGQVEKLLVSAIHYNVMGQIEAETAGNGVITRHCYDEANGRLTELSAHKANGIPLQVLTYQYDAVGNVLSIEDAAQPIRYFNNQRITPVKKYRYDTLYQLIEATGCEAKSGQSGPAALEFHTLPIDPSQIANYTQTYHYDAAGNLLELVHLGAQAHGRTLTRERYSNRCLPQRDNRPTTEEELAKGFDANGNLRELQAGQPLGWDLRNQLSAVQLIVRKNAEDDRECYVYDGGGQRVRKVNVSQSNARTLTREVRYLPGLQIRMHDPSEGTFHVITASAGSNSVQVLHWVAKRPSEVAQDQLRYSLNDHLKSSALELDQHADLISQEWYYPFGGTAYWAGANAVEAQYKTVSYSGKERDATGLYYYGFRYYAPWLQRWVNPDPAGYVDGMNLYAMVMNNPNATIDYKGLCSEKPIPKIIRHIWIGKTVDNFTQHESNIINTKIMNPGYIVEVNFRVEQKNYAYQSVVSRLHNAGVKTKNIDDSRWFKKFRSSPRYEQYSAATTGSRPNLASASDILRKELMMKGGIYTDADDIYIRPLPLELPAKNNQILTSKPVTFSRWDDSQGVHISVFGVHKNNKLLKKISADSFEEFKAHQGVIYEINQTTNNYDDNFRLNSTVAGSHHFSKFVVNQSLDFQRAYKLATEKNHENSLVKQHMPFANIVQQVTTSGAGDMSEEQAMDWLQRNSLPGHVII